LKLIGFGVEIRSKTNVEAIYLADDAEARSLARIDAKSYGTRHRSMMRYCSAHPSSVGFVVSQDGDVRAITKVGERLVVWDQLQLTAGMSDDVLFPPYVRKKLQSQ
jgi:hypothetical protein